MKIINLGSVDYQDTWQKMQKFTDTRDDSSEDELWICKHPKVFTQGLAGKDENVLTVSEIPIIKTDRGGQVTYHGPGQIVVYCLVDLKRAHLGVKKMVQLMEKSIIDLLSKYAIKSHLKAGAPGVYVDGAKIAALGLKVKKGMTYHGLSLNVDMDLSPFEQINPCGYAGLKVTQMIDLTDNKLDLDNLSLELAKNIEKHVTRN